MIDYTVKQQDTVHFTIGESSYWQSFNSSYKMHDFKMLWLVHPELMQPVTNVVFEEVNQDITIVVDDIILFVAIAEKYPQLNIKVLSRNRKLLTHFADVGYPDNLSVVLI